MQVISCVNSIITKFWIKLTEMQHKMHTLGETSIFGTVFSSIIKSLLMQNENHNMNNIIFAPVYKVFLCKNIINNYLTNLDKCKTNLFRNPNCNINEKTKFRMIKNHLGDSNKLGEWHLHYRNNIDISEWCPSI